MIVVERPPGRSEQPGQRKDNSVRIKLFGQMEIETEQGRVIEGRKGDSKPFLLMKRLFLRWPEHVSMQELLETVFPASTESDIRVYLFRARRELDPIGLGGKKGLISYSEGCFYLNPDNPLQMDLTQFEQVTEALTENSAADEPALQMCAEALELCRGALLSNTKDVAWIDERRRECQRRFRALLRDTLHISEALGSREVMPLLFRRAAELEPDDRELRERVERYWRQAGLADKTSGLVAVEGPLRISPSEEVETKLPPSRQGQWKPSQAAPDDKLVRVNLFGELKIENSLGCYREKQGKQRKPVLLLKYLLLNPGKVVDYRELPSELLDDGTEIKRQYNTFRVQLSRARDELAPLGLSGDKGLITFSGGFLQLNPDYDLQIDADRFGNLLEQLKKYPPEDPRGLELCGEALTLYCGGLLESTCGVPWLAAYQESYQNGFRAVAFDTVKRNRACRDSRVMSILCDRAATLAPGDESLHREIVHCLMEFGLAQEMTVYISQLVASGKATWLEKEITR